MNFAEAYRAMTEGKKVKRPGFKGFWAINPEDGQPYIHLADGKDISYGKLGITMKNAAATDWEIVEEK